MCSVDMPWPVVGQCGAVLGQCGAGEGGAGPLILTLVHIRTYFHPCRAQRPRSNLPRRLIRWSTLSVLICPPPPGDTTPPHLVLRTLHIVCCRVSAGSLFAPRAALSLLGPALFEPSCAACPEATWINSLICTPRPSPCTLTTPANLMHLAASCKVLAILHIPSGSDRILTFRYPAR